MARRRLGGLSRPKRWLFRLLALTLAPLLLLGLVELALRLVGFGYPTPFFLAARRGGQTVLVENTEFGRRFFPPALARAPLPMVLSRQKPTGVYRNFVMGGSATKGEPEPSIGFARILKVLLEARCEGQRFEIVNVAATAIFPGSTGAPRRSATGSCLRLLRGQSARHSRDSEAERREGRHEYDGREPRELRSVRLAPFGRSERGRQGIVRRPLPSRE